MTLIIFASRNHEICIMSMCAAHVELCRVGWAFTLGGLMLKSKLNSRILGGDSGV